MFLYHFTELILRCKNVVLCIYDVWDETLNRPTNPFSLLHTYPPILALRTVRGLAPDNLEQCCTLLRAEIGCLKYKASKLRPFLFARLRTVHSEAWITFGSTSYLHSQSVQWRYGISARNWVQIWNRAETDLSSGITLLDLVLSVQYTLLQILKSTNQPR